MERNDQDKIYCAREDLKEFEDEYSKIESGEMVPRHPDPCIDDILDRLERVEAVLFGKKRESI